MLYINGKEIEPIRSIDTQTMIDNIDIYKYQDLAFINQNGGELAIDDEYIAAEITLQELYTKIMMGGKENE